MANPQKEHGFTPIAHELVRALVRAGLSGRQWDVMMYLFMETYGQQRKAVCISYAAIGRALGMHKQVVYKTIASLAKSKMVTVVGVTLHGDGVAKTIGIQKDYELWASPQRVTQVEKGYGSVVREGDGGQPLSPRPPISNVNSKKRKENPPVVPPPGGPQPAKPEANGNGAEKRNGTERRTPLPFWQRLVAHVSQSWQAKKRAPYPWTGHEATMLHEVARTYQAWGTMALWDLYMTRETYWGTTTRHMIQGFRKSIGELVDMDRGVWKVMASKYETDLHAAEGAPLASAGEVLRGLGLEAKRV